MRLSRVLRLLLSVVTFAAISPAIAQQAWPTKPVRLVLGFAAGGTTDIVSRLTAARLQELWGQPVIVENKTGAGGVIGADFVAKSPPDGYTLLMQSTGPHAIAPYLMAKFPFDPVNDLIPVSNVANNALALMVHPSIPVKSVAEFIAYARANPGKLNFGSSGNGSTTHLAGEILKSMAGLNLVHVPFKGGPPAAAALLAGDTQFMFANLSDALPNLKSGKLRVLAVSSSSRQLQAPDLPTVAESGLPGFDVAPWNGIMVPGKTPPAVVAVIASSVQRVVKEPAFLDKMKDIGTQAIGDTPEAFRATVQFELQRWSKIVKDAGIKAE